MTSFDSPSDFTAVTNPILVFRYIDSFEEVLGEHGSIRELWYYRLEVRDVFTKSISDGPEQPTHAMGYLNFLSQAVENATIYDPNEKDRIGAESINMAHEFMEKIMERVFSLIEPIAKEYIHFDYQYADYMAIYPVLEKRPEFKADRNYRTPNPGSESQYVSRQSIETYASKTNSTCIYISHAYLFFLAPLRLRLYEKNVWQLCSALNDIGSLYIYNVVVTPREYLVERIRKLLKSVIARFSYLPQENQVFKDEHTIQTPAVLARSFFVYAGICKSLENYVDIDVGSVISYVLVHQSHAPSLGVVGQKLDWLTASAFDFSKNLIKVIVTWYSDFFSKRIAALTGPHSSTGAPHIIYSPLRQGFYSRRGNAFRVENYCDIKELRTLVSLVGPYGVKLIDRELLRLAQGHIAVIRDIMKQYGKELDEFYNVYQHEAKTALLIKQFRGSFRITYLSNSHLL
jgi:NCK-associated protein 1